MFLTGLIVGAVTIIVAANFRAWARSANGAHVEPGLEVSPTLRRIRGCEWRYRSHAGTDSRQAA